jgi:UDP-N-acetylglucosamine--N-acetylmuramyl-(pentapeptide) pyrophosphoryl-undecaprenol N-acetylglucosamine transferase
MTERPRKHRLMIAGGGTGGHVLAGVAVADAWKARYGAESEVLFVGAQGGIEEKLVPRAGYPLELLRLGSLKRTSLLKRLRTLFLLPLSLVRSFALLIKNRPEAVLGVGGYASGPFVLVARLFARTAILEQNSVVGLTNKLLGKVSHQVFAAFPGTEGQFAGRKVVVTGNPVRPQIKPFARASRDPFTIFIFGGSQGAMGINTLVLESLDHLKSALPRLRFIHQTGERDFERVRDGYAARGVSARVEKFIHDMPEAYAQASLLICRAGSSTLAELAAVGRASILIPFPQAADNHQEVNARVFVDRGAAELLIQGKSTGRDLADLIGRLIADTSRIDAMESAIARLYKPESAQDIVKALSAPINPA